MHYSEVLTKLDLGFCAARLRWNNNLNEGDYDSLTFIYLHSSKPEPLPDLVQNFGDLFSCKTVTLLDHYRKKNKSQTSKGWNASQIVSVYTPPQEDLFAKDWYIIPFGHDWSKVCGKFD